MFPIVTAEWLENSKDQVWTFPVVSLLLSPNILSVSLQTSDEVHCLSKLRTSKSVGELGYLQHLLILDSSTPVRGSKTNPRRKKYAVSPKCGCWYRYPSRLLSTNSQTLPACLHTFVTVNWWCSSAWQVSEDRMRHIKLTLESCTAFLENGTLGERIRFSKKYGPRRNVVLPPIFDYSREL